MFCFCTYDVLAFVSEIGPDFSPDIKGHPQNGLQPLGHVFFPLSTYAAGKQGLSQGLKPPLMGVPKTQAKAWVYLKSNYKDNYTDSSNTPIKTTSYIGFEVLTCKEIL